MSEISRRRFIRNGAIAAAAAGTAVAAPSIIGAGAAGAAGPTTPAEGAAVAAGGIGASATASGTEGLLAHIVDPASGLIEVYVGTRQIDIHDPAIARALSAAAGK